MNTETKTLRIRRATPLDAVNLYRLLVDEEKRAGTGAPFDEASRIAHILTTIAVGYVTVAVLSGRIVGSIGAVPSAPSYSDEKPLTGQWLVLLPSFRDTKVGVKLVEGLARFADLHGLGISFTLPYPVLLTTVKAAEAIGFEATALTYSREPRLKIDEPVGDQEQTAEPDDPVEPDVAGRELPE